MAGVLLWIVAGGFGAVFITALALAYRSGRRDEAATRAAARDEARRAAYSIRDRLRRDAGYAAGVFKRFRR